MNKITCVCLGVKSMEKAIKFYRDGLGYKTDCRENNPPQIGSEFGGITLTYNVEKKDEVDKIIELVRNAGGTIVKEPQNVFWGGYHAYFKDLDGYYWEVAWGPDFKYDENGMLQF